MASSLKLDHHVKFCFKKLPLCGESRPEPLDRPNPGLRGNSKPDFVNQVRNVLEPLCSVAEQGAQASASILKSISRNLPPAASVDFVKKGLEFTKASAANFMDNVRSPDHDRIRMALEKSDLFLCSTSLAKAGNDLQAKEGKENSPIEVSNKTPNAENRLPSTSSPKSRTDGTKNKKSMGIPFLGEEEEERVLISEVLIKEKDGQELENTEILNIARAALKASKPNHAVTTKEVNDDIHRVIGTGYFMSCVARADETRDGFCLTYLLEPNQVIKGVIVNQANALPAKVIEEAFREDFGKIANLHRLNAAISALDQWYYDRGLFGQVANMDLQPDGILRIHLPEAEVNNITISFRDRKTGEPTTGKTKPETLLRQLMTKKGQIYSQHLGQRDAETVFTMGIMEDVNIIPQASENGMVDLTMNVVERVDGGFSAGGGLSGNSFANGALSAIIGSFAYSHRNAFGRNQKFNVSLERGQYDSMFRINYTDPWIEGDDKRTSRSINIQNSRSPGTTVHGALREGQNSLQRPGTVTIGRIIASVDYSRPLRPKWSGTAGLSFQRAGARDDHGFPKLVDSYGCPLTFSGRASDDMLIAKLETVYTDSGDNGSSQFVFNTEQGIPIFPEWLFFNRVIVRARQGMRIGPVRCIASFSGGTVIGDLAPHEAFPIGGTNSVRGYDEGAVGSGRSYIVGCGEISVPLVGPLEGALFADFGTDLGSGEKVLGNPAGVRGKPGKGHGFGAGIRLDSPLGPLRLEYACSDRNVWRFHFGIGYRN